MKRVQIVLSPSRPEIFELCVRFGALLEEFKSSTLNSAQGNSGQGNDVFVSYRHSDLPTTDALLRALLKARSNLRIWMDREKLEAGCFWKPELIRAIGDARHGLCVVTDIYPDSPECMDEFHAALCCERFRRGYLLPVLALQQRPVSSLPQSMRQVQFLEAQDPQCLADRILQAIRVP